MKAIHNAPMQEIWVAPNIPPSVRAKSGTGLGSGEPDRVVVSHYKAAATCWITN